MFSSPVALFCFASYGNRFRVLLRPWPPVPGSHLFSSPLASLCFSLYATRSASAKPSCAVMKLMLAVGARPPFHLRPPVFCHQSPSPGCELL